MPGLAGIYTETEDTSSAVTQMANTLRQQPWLHSEIAVEGPLRVARVHLGHFNQTPMPRRSADGSVCVWLYGNAYDYQPKLEQLENKYHFEVGDAAEFCLHAFEEWGTDFIPDLNGTFVLVIYEGQTRRLTLVNDRFGLHPLYYRQQPGKLQFASEVKALLAAVDSKPPLSEAALADFMVYGGLYQDKTFFEGIKYLSPASLLSYQDDNLDLTTYWQVRYAAAAGVGETELVERLATTLTRAVNIRVNEDLRFALSLSGGYDSRVLAAAITPELRRHITGYNFGIPGCDDVKLASETARKASMPFAFEAIDPGTVPGAAMERLVFLCDGMLTAHAGFALQTYHQARDYCDVLMEGLGTGTTLAGRHLNLGLLNAAPDELVQALNQRRVFGHGLPALLREKYLAKFEALALDSAGQAVATARAVTDTPLDCLDHAYYWGIHHREMSMGYNPLIQNYLETATPTYDYDFFDVVLSVPAELRQHHRVFRQLLIRLDAELARIRYQGTMLPADAPLWMWRPAYIYQKGKTRLRRLAYQMSGGRIDLKDKNNFLPIHDWFRSNPAWRRYTREMLLSETSRLREYCHQDYIAQLIRDHEAGRAFYSGALNQLLTFEIFLRLFAE